MLKTLQFPNFFTGSFFASRQKKQSFRAPQKPQAAWLGFFLAAVSAMVLMSYLLGVNSYSSKGYEIKSLQTKLLLLTEENKKMNLKVSEVSSMVGIQNDLQNSNFVSVGTPLFLQVNQFSQK